MSEYDGNDRLESLLSRGKFLIDQFCSRGTNTFDWSMHIPARPDKDPDLVFSEIMRISKNLKAENKQLKALLKEVVSEMDDRDCTFGAVAGEFIECGCLYHDIMEALKGESDD